MWPFKKFKILAVEDRQLLTDGTSEGPYRTIATTPKEPTMAEELAKVAAAARIKKCNDNWDNFLCVANKTANEGGNIFYMKFEELYEKEDIIKRGRKKGFYCKFWDNKHVQVQFI